MSLPAFFEVKYFVDEIYKYKEIVLLKFGSIDKTFFYKLQTE